MLSKKRSARMLRLVCDRHGLRRPLPQQRCGHASTPLGPASASHASERWRRLSCVLRLCCGDSTLTACGRYCSRATAGEEALAVWGRAAGEPLGGGVRRRSGSSRSLGHALSRESPAAPEQAVMMLARISRQRARSEPRARRRAAAAGAERACGCSTSARPAASARRGRHHRLMGASLAGKCTLRGP
jgi:hypothetical protein